MSTSLDVHLPKAPDWLDHSTDDEEAGAGAEGGDAVVRLVNVHKTYLLGVEGVPALRGVSLGVRRGEFLVILGKSGSGKTTMLNVCGTIDKPTKGSLFIDGSRVTAETPDATLAHIRLKKIGFVFQTFNLISSMTALQNVELPMILAAELSAAQITRRAKELLASVGMEPRLHHYPSQLSGGEQQRVTIARSLANRPNIMLLDEPTGDLDTRNSNIAMKLLTDLNRRQGITMVMVTHDVGMKQYANRVIHMLDGKIHRIEHIDSATRQQADLQLEQSLQSHVKRIQPDPHIEIRTPNRFYASLRNETIAGHHTTNGTPTSEQRSNGVSVQELKS